MLVRHIVSDFAIEKALTYMTPSVGQIKMSTAAEMSLPERPIHSEKRGVASYTEMSDERT